MSEHRPEGVANRVREMREAQYLTRRELAELAGLSVRTIWSVENGHSSRLVTRRALLRALGVTPEEGAKVFPAPSARQPAVAEANGH